MLHTRKERTVVDILNLLLFCWPFVSSLSLLLHHSLSFRPSIETYMYIWPEIIYIYILSMRCRVSSVAMFQRPYVNGVATYRLIMWTGCIETLETKLFVDTPFFCTLPRVDAQKSRPLSFYLLSLEALFLAPFLARFLRGTCWKWPGPKTL